MYVICYIGVRINNQFDFKVDSSICIYLSPSDYTVQTQRSRAQVYKLEQ